MGTEIERKFLVISDQWQQQADRSTAMVQGYLSRGAERSVRVRTSGSDSGSGSGPGRAYLNIKSSTNGITRSEYEYEIPLPDANEILDKIAIKPVIDKVRYFVEQGNHTWEIDVFGRENKGLIIAEIELDSEDEFFEKPAWLGMEVSEDPRFYNMNIENQEWRKVYPEELLIRYGGTVHENIRYEISDCPDGC